MADTTIEEKLRRLANLRAEIRQLQEEIAEAGSRALDAEAEPVGETIADDDLARLIVNRSHDLITVHNVDGTYLWISANCEEFLGIPREKLIGTSAYDLFHPEDLNRIAHDHADTLDISSSHVTYRLRQGDGSYRWAETRSYLNRTLDGTVRLVAITRDVHDRITEQERARHVERRLKERLMDLASTDGLTRLMNRMSGDATLRREVSRVRRSGTQLSVVLADIDHFKSINDRFGHSVGDAVLVGTAQIMRDTVREYDSVSRWGGEEFLLVLPETGPQDAAVLAERVRCALESANNASGEQVTLSAGVATLAPDETVEVLLARADSALYRAKDEGRNRVVSGAPPTP